MVLFMMVTSRINQKLSHSLCCVRLSTVKGYTRKGCVLFALKRFRDAQKTYEKALELDPENKVAFQ